MTYRKYDVLGFSTTILTSWWCTQWLGTTRQSNLSTMLSLQNSTFFTCRLTVVHETASTLESDAAIKPIVSICDLPQRPVDESSTPLKDAALPNKTLTTCPPSNILSEEPRWPTWQITEDHFRNAYRKARTPSTKTSQNKKKLACSTLVHCNVMLLAKQIENKHRCIAMWCCWQRFIHQNLKHVDRRICWADIQKCLQDVNAFFVCPMWRSILNKEKTFVGSQQNQNPRTKPTQWACKTIRASKSRNNRDSRATLWKTNRQTNFASTLRDPDYLECAIHDSVSEPAPPEPTLRDEKSFKPRRIIHHLKQTEHFLSTLQKPRNIEWESAENSTRTSKSAAKKLSATPRAQTSTR